MPDNVEQKIFINEEKIFSFYFIMFSKKYDISNKINKMLLNFAIALNFMWGIILKWLILNDDKQRRRLHCIKNW